MIRRISTFALLILVIAGAVADSQPAGPDLIVSGLDASGAVADHQTLAVSGDVDVTIKNAGGTLASGGFSVVLFEDANGNNAPDGGEPVFGEQAVAGDLAPGAEATVSIPVSGTAAFADNLIHAYVDPHDLVAEVSEGNNSAGSGASCEFHPPIGAF